MVLVPAGLPKKAANEPACGARVSTPSKAGSMDVVQPEKSPVSKPPLVIRLACAAMLADVAAAASTPQAAAFFKTRNAIVNTSQVVCLLSAVHHEAAHSRAARRHISVPGAASEFH